MPYVDRIVASGAKIWIPKILDGTGNYNGSQLETATVYAKRAGLEVWTWGYERDGRYADPGAEGAKLGMRSQALYADAVIADVEAEWVASDSSVEPFLASLTASFGNKGPIYFSSYSTTRYHPEFPWKEFIAKTDGVVPQDYQTPVGDWLDRTSQDFTALGAKKIIPVGYADHTLGVDGDAVRAFLTAAEARNMDIATLWVIDHMEDTHWAAVKAFTGS